MEVKIWGWDPIILLNFLHFCAIKNCCWKKCDCAQSLWGLKTVYRLDARFCAVGSSRFIANWSEVEKHSPLNIVISNSSTYTEN
jgi:hypothetical protein